MTFQTSFSVRVVNSGQTTYWIEHRKTRLFENEFSEIWMDWGGSAVNPRRIRGSIKVQGSDWHCVNQKNDIIEKPVDFSEKSCRWPLVLNLIGTENHTVVKYIPVLVLVHLYLYVLLYLTFFRNINRYKSWFGKSFYSAFLVFTVSDKWNLLRFLTQNEH